SGNDLAWGGPDGVVIAVNAECEDHGDPSLAVLTNHLLIGFEDRVIRERESLQISGRGALRTRVAATLDGVPVEMELTVLKKDGCVYDLVYLAPPHRFEEHVSTYRRVVASFDAPGRRSMRETALGTARNSAPLVGALRAGFEQVGGGVLLAWQVFTRGFRGRIDLGAIVYQIEHIGIRSTAIGTLTALFAGMVLTVQF